MNRSTYFLRAIAALLTIVSLSVLIGWQFDIPVLKSFFSEDMAPMVGNSAISFLFCAIILILLTRADTALKELSIRFLSSLILLIGTLTFIEYVGEVNFGIDQLLFKHPAFAGDNPGRMSILSAMNFTLAGFCFWLDRLQFDPRNHVSQYGMLMIFFTTLYSFSGTLFGAEHLGSVHTTMAIPTALCFFLISVAYFIKRGDTGWAVLLFTDNVAGVLIRRILIPVALLYPIFIFISIQGEKAGFYNTEGGAAFTMVTSLMLFTMIVLVAAQTISKVDEERDQFRKFFELSSEVLMIATSDGAIKLVSNAFTKVLGYTNQEGVSHSFFHFVRPEEVPHAVEQFSGISSERQPGSFQLAMKDKHGKLRHFLWSHTLDEKTGLIYAAGYDITEIKEAQQVRELAQRLTHQNEQLASFAHIVSHNLRSHVGNLNSLLQLHEVAEEKEKTALFEMFQRVSRHLSGTLDDLVETLRVKEDINKDRPLLYFNQVLNKTLEILSNHIAASGAVIRHEFHVKSIAYPGVYLESIFLNLISNAIKYRSPSRPLKVSVETFLDGNQVVLTVEDNGKGIDMGLYGDKLFGFYKTFHGGEDAKGLGLFITRNQVEAMGGTISAESEVEKGTKFRVVLGTSPGPYSS